MPSFMGSILPLAVRAGTAYATGGQSEAYMAGANTLNGPGYATDGSQGSSAITDLLGNQSDPNEKGFFSIFSDPTVLSASILSGTSLLSNLFGGSSQEQISKDQFDATLANRKDEFAANQALEREQLAQALEIAKMQASAAGAGASASRANAASARDAALRQAKIQAIGNAATLKSQALQMPLAAIGQQAEMAQNTGVQSGGFFSNLMTSLQQPALRSAS